MSPFFSVDDILVFALTEPHPTTTVFSFSPSVLFLFNRRPFSSLVVGEFCCLVPSLLSFTAPYRKADRKRKGKAVSSSSQVIPRFKTLYHEAHFNATLSARRILPELILQADENIFNPIRFQIHQRKWEKFTKPIQAVGHLMVKEFYVNAWEPDKAKRKPYIYTSSVRGTEISFAPSNIKRVLKLKKDPIPDAPSYHERKASKDYRLDHILEDMCEEGAEWLHHRDGRPHFLRRSDLKPMTKGWYEFVCRSILPTTNRSELTVERAVLIHSIIIGEENINVEEIIAE
ncbi:hypothetical protein PIB30_085797 [Stylosanthes scabra]|uniref:Putative plant transposon protein domain-containing protein n=1 Tax=Stylosanthes scabra TaxID=79078 RepID=A0ABU6RT95_9FABA|nr:hypothetical protein [Stylosanthes scabra]